MDRIQETLKNTLDEEKLTDAAKQKIYTKSSLHRRKLVPFISVLVAAIVLFLMWSTNATTVDEKVPITTNSSQTKNLEQSILTYYNSAAAALKTTDRYFFVGDGYAMRLALETNSAYFYGNTNLSHSDQLLLSKLLHYLQEGLYEREAVELAQPITSIKELLEAAPATINQLKNVATISYTPIQHELSNSKKIAHWGLLPWVVFAAISLAVVYVVLSLWRKGHRVPPMLLAAFGLFLLFSLTMTRSDVGYDEASMLQLAEQQLDEMNVRKVGEPIIEAVAGYHDQRFLMFTYEDGLTALATFKHEKGYFVYYGMKAGADRQTTVEYTDDSKRMLILGLPIASNTKSIQLTEDHITSDKIPFTPGQPAILLYINEAKNTEYQIE